MLAASIVVRILITGIVAIVPSAKDKDLTRLIAPRHVHLDDRTHHPTIPDHFAYIEVLQDNYVESGSVRKPDFRFTNGAVQRVVFLLKSEEVKLLSVPANTTLTRNTTVPTDPLAPVSDVEKTSTFYKLHMSRLCPNCTTLVNDYFDVMKNPDKVSARMDLRGGHETVMPPNVKEVWHAKDSMIRQPLAQEVVYTFAMPAGDQRLQFIEAPAFVGDTARTSEIRLTGNPIEVRFGNAPLTSILRLDDDFKGEHRDDHFSLVYDMFPAPKRRILQLLCDPVKPVSGPGDNCIPPTTDAQDPNP